MRAKGALIAIGNLEMSAVGRAQLGAADGEEKSGAAVPGRKVRPSRSLPRYHCRCKQCRDWQVARRIAILKA
jgi:hypothetical protein